MRILLEANTVEETMHRIRLAGIAAALTALLTAPALAQPAGQPGAAANPSAATTNAGVPGGTLQKMHNNWRGRTLIGTAVYNDSNERIATINDLLITDDGRVDQVVLAVRRMRGKLVTVPFGQLRFAPSTNPGLTGLGAAEGMTSPPVSSIELKNYGVVLAGATRDSLAKMEPFRFAP
jgi:PRC-barrel domain